MIRATLQKIKSWILSHKKTSIAVAVVLLIVVLAIAFGGPAEPETYTVTSRTVSDQVVVSGKVQLSDEIDLSFGEPGTVQRVLVTAGQSVKRGQLLAQLDVATLQAQRMRVSAQLRQAEIAANQNKLELSTEQEEYNRFQTDINSQLNAAVVSFMSDSLTAVPDNSAAELLDAPVITGALNNFPVTLDTALSITPIKYKVTFEKITANLRTGIKVSGYDSGEVFTSKNSPVEILDSGIYISVADDDEYINSEWVIELPNRSSASYASNYNSFVTTITDLRQARISKSRTADDAKIRLGGTVNETTTNLDIARADLAEIDAQIRQKSLYAPFDGVVGMIDVRVGDTVTTSKIVSTVIGSKQSYLVKLKVPEGSVAKIEPMLPVSLVLDADRKTTFAGQVASVSPSETYVDGVPVYETVVQFNESDPIIRSGMNVVATITAQEKTNVLAVPRSAIIFDGEKASVVIAESQESRPVTLGLLGSDNYFEVTSGLAAGDIVVVQKAK